MSFKRSSSKVWWASEDAFNFRSASASPKSQDSGFSDSDANTKIRLDISKKTLQKTENYTINSKEKTFPKKEFHSLLDPEAKKPEFDIRSEPTNKLRFIKNHSPKVTRNLFPSTSSFKKANRYSGNVLIKNRITYETQEADSSWSSTEEANLTVPLIKGPRRIDFNITAPAVLTEIAYQRDPEEIRNSFGSLSPIPSDTDSEIECLFSGIGDSPKHTSTPKVFSRSGSSRFSRRSVMNLSKRFEREEEFRVPPLHIKDGTALKKWYEETRNFYEPECTTTLQSKSIAAELAEKVSNLAAIVTMKLSRILTDVKTIENELENLKNQNSSKHKDSLIQSSTGLIKEFLQAYPMPNTRNLKKYCEELRTFKLSDTIIKLEKSFSHHSSNLVESEVFKFVEGLEEPESEMDLRAKVTGLTWMCQRNPKILEILMRTSIIQNLVILCEKCDGSSVRGSILRALTTLCCTSMGIRQFERSSAIQTIADIVYERSYPEPEKSEAIALLAQITAPWIEDNHKINGLQEHVKKLISALTEFLRSTTCCQNLLLTTAALANLTTMEPKAIKYILHQNTVKILLESIKKRGPLTSIFLYEQLTTLIGNLSTVESARKQLTEDEIPKVLVCFVQQSRGAANHRRDREEVLKRLQQRAIIALSRLCSEAGASEQVVEAGGIPRLVKLCREKAARYDSDAVLVATLATLRRIAENCGTSSIDTQDVQELVEPRLLDSFLAYSAQNESLV